MGELTANDRKVFLICDGYLAHLSLKVLEIFSNNNVVVYALPVHNSGKTQPLDRVQFSSFKNAMNQICSNFGCVPRSSKLDICDFCSIMRETYLESFTVKNIQSSFRLAGIWPLNPQRLLSVARPADSSCTSVLSVADGEEDFENTGRV